MQYLLDHGQVIGYTMAGTGLVVLIGSVIALVRTGRRQAQERPWTRGW
jgi:hypothetical protein